MNISYFIAKRIIRKGSVAFSRFIIRLATIATALSVAVMIIAVAVVLGFKENIKDKMFVFWGHIQITQFNPNPSSIISPEPFEYDTRLTQQIKAVPGVESVAPYALKPAIIQAGSIMEGIKIKGITADYPLVSNNAISFSGEGINFEARQYAHQVVLSSTTLNRIGKKVGDTVIAYFIDPEQDFPRLRKLQISGSYHTGMDEIDKNFAFCDIRLLQRVANWTDNDINGYQVSVSNYREADILAEDIYQHYLEPPLTKNTMEDIYPNVFSWLDLMNRNAYIVLVIMAAVAVINLSTALLIFLLERTNMIGVLKTLGMPMRKIRNIFLYHSAVVSLKGIFWGIFFGLGFCLVQYHTHLISLDESAYYMQYVPIKIEAWHVVAIGAGTMVFCLAVLLIPLMIIRKISIIKAIRFK